MKNQPKIGPKSIENRFGGVPWGSMGPPWRPNGLSGPILTPFCTQLGVILGGQIGPCWGHVDQKIGSRRHQKTDMILNTFEDPFGDEFGTNLGSFGTNLLSYFARFFACFACLLASLACFALLAYSLCLIARLFCFALRILALLALLSWLCFLAFLRPKHHKRSTEIDQK